MKKPTILFVVFILIILLIGILYGASFFTKNENFSSVVPSLSPAPPPPSMVPSLPTINKTSSAGLIASLGKPISTKTQGGEAVLSYPTKNRYWYNEYYFQNDTLVFIRERIFPLSSDTYNKRVASLDGSPSVLFGPDARSGIYLYSFPEKGVSFLANKESGFVYEEWTHPRGSANELLLLPQFQGYSLNQKFKPEGVPR